MSYLRGAAVRRMWIPEGHAGIDATVEEMARLARRESVATPVVALARTMRRSSGRATAARIREYLAERMRFEFDPFDVELVRSPSYLIREIERTGFASGDCDDVATLGAALALAARIPARYVLVGFSKAAPFEHVFTELLTEAGPVELDTTKPEQFPPGLRIGRLGYREI